MNLGRMPQAKDTLMHATITIKACHDCMLEVVVREKERNVDLDLSPQTDSLPPQTGASTGWIVVVNNLMGFNAAETEHHT